MRTQKTKSSRPLPYTMKLNDGRTLFVEIPAIFTDWDRDGSILIKPAGVRFLDQLRALAMEMGDKPTAGHILALRQALGMTQRELGQKLGKDRLTVSRWERGDMSPGPGAVSALQALRRKAAASGVVLPDAPPSGSAKTPIKRRPSRAA